MNFYWEILSERIFPHTMILLTDFMHGLVVAQSSSLSYFFPFEISISILKVTQKLLQIMT